MAEQLIRNEQVVSSILTTSSKKEHCESNALFFVKQILRIYEMCFLLSHIPPAGTMTIRITAFT